jgi:hypothetical protein
VERGRRPSAARLGALLLPVGFVGTSLVHLGACDLSYLGSGDGGGGGPAGADASIDGARLDAAADRSGVVDSAMDGTMDGGSETDCGPFLVPGTSSLSDDFSSGSLSPNWFTPTASSVQETGGELVTTPVPNDPGSYCFAGTNQSYHLTCDSITVRIPQVGTQEHGVQTFIYVDGVNNPDRLNIILEDTGFVMYASQPDGGMLGMIQVSAPYEPTPDLWWRVRETGGNVYFETSPDGTTWTVQGQGPDPIPLDDVTVLLGAGTYEAIANPGAAKFQCYNVPAASCP